mmetsp:Transcript_5216/g.8821  ORF Transcript_5216/g.8821 Transcript_5216/m.8821 type:complete len:212 (-) Transcript_5216:287-922(-)
MVSTRLSTRSWPTMATRSSVPPRTLCRCQRRALPLLSMLGVLGMAACTCRLLALSTRTTASRSVSCVRTLFAPVLRVTRMVWQLVALVISLLVSLPALLVRRTKFTAGTVARTTLTLQARSTALLRVSASTAPTLTAPLLLTVRSGCPGVATARSTHRVAPTQPPSSLSPPPLFLLQLPLTLLPPLALPPLYLAALLLWWLFSPSLLFKWA